MVLQSWQLPSDCRHLHSHFNMVVTVAGTAGVVDIMAVVVDITAVVVDITAVVQEWGEATITAVVQE